MLTGHFRRVSDGALYPAIARLEKQGLITRTQEPGEVAAPRQVLSLTDLGKESLLQRLRTPDDGDISDRNRFFTWLAFLKYLSPPEQIDILSRRLAFLEGGRSFFRAGNRPVSMAEETDIFRKGMLHIARETSRVERDWLKATIAALSDSNTLA